MTNASAPATTSLGDHLYIRRLTRRAFMQLPKGCFLIGNRFTGDREPDFRLIVVDVESRHVQWTLLGAVRAHQRAAHAFPDAEACARWLAQLPPW